MSRDGLVREAGAVQCGIQKIAGGIAGEDTPGAIRAVRPRRKSDDDDARVRIAKTRDRSTPVRPLAVRAALLARDAFAVADEARAAVAGGDGRVEVIPS